METACYFLLLRYRTYGSIIFHIFFVKAYLMIVYFLEENSPLIFSYVIGPVSYVR